MEENSKRRPGFVAQYQCVLDARQSEFNKYFEISELCTLHEAAHIRLLEMEQVVAVTADRREARILSLATRLLAEGLCNIACANYQLAFFCLRSFLELSTAAIKFSAVELEMRQWEVGGRDIVWANISVGDTGVYSRPFVAAFFPLLEEEHKHYASLASRVYRECSEYVHANPASHANNVLDEARVRQWFSLFDAATTCVTYAFFVRYQSDVDLSENSAPEVNAIFVADLGHFPGVVEALSGVGANG